MSEEITGQAENLKICDNGGGDQGVWPDRRRPEWSGEAAQRENAM
jgi:hypothetical protein